MIKQFTPSSRFYGESHPTPNLSLSNMEYLSSRQALADVNYFIGVMNTKLKLTTKNRWISFGGSYSGALSGWVRQLYPDRVAGAVATSAPVLATEDFSAYLEVVSASLQSSSHGVHVASVGQLLKSIRIQLVPGSKIFIDKTSGSFDWL